MTLVLYLVSIVVRAVTIAFLWLWFIVPLGAPNINLLEALGISTFVAVFTTSVSDLAVAKEKRVSTFESAVYTLFIYIFALIFGFIYHSLGAGIQ